MPRPSSGREAELLQVPRLHQSPETKWAQNKEFTEVSDAEILDRISRQHIVLLGIPGSGKTTLAQTLRARNDSIRYISLGEISRNLAPDSPERSYINELFAHGSPVGDPNFFLSLLEPYIDESIAAGNGFILDGMPKKLEEVESLLQFMQAKGISLDTIISCELDPVTAYNRIAVRGIREGDQDTMDVFTNRTRIYLQNLARFKEDLSSDGARVIDINTEDLDQQQCADHLLAAYKIDEDKTIHHSNAIDIVRLSKEVRRGGFDSAAAQLAPFFDDNFESSLPYADIFSPNTSPEQRLAIIMEAMLAKNPELRHMPLMNQRLAKNYIATTVASIEHLVVSLAEEIQAVGGEITNDHIERLLREQLETKRLIMDLQKELIDGKDFCEIVDGEIDENATELKYISSKLIQIAQARGYSDFNLDPATLMRTQPLLWGQLTSRRILFAPDTNYRRTANGIVGSHHSLLPYSRTNRALSANSMADYLPFIEAVSSSDYIYSSTFGFIHLVGVDKTGEAFGVEYPIMMHDKRLLDIESDKLHELLAQTDSFYSTHDIWHNIIPVYADHFILHHPDAPLSYGGRQTAYLDFGHAKRQEKEEYEIGVAMAHAKTQQERFALDPQLREQQIGIVMNVIDELQELKDELFDKAPDQALDIVDFLSARAASNLFNVLPPEDPIYDVLDAKLKALSLPPVTVNLSEITELIIRQRLVDPHLLPEGMDTDDIVSLAKKDDVFARTIVSLADGTTPNRESGSEFLLKALREFDIMDAAIDGTQNQFNLSGMHKVRWIAMMAPQRQQLKGHMEKVHGKNGQYKYGDKVLDDVRELVHLQQEALQADMPHYLYRMHARAENQQISYSAYSICFDDGQPLNEAARGELRYITTHENQSLQYAVRQLHHTIDKLIDSLVHATYAFSIDDSVDLEDQGALFAKAGYMNLGNTIREIARRYVQLLSDEKQYQNSIGTTYPEALERIVQDQMSIT